MCCIKSYSSVAKIKIPTLVHYRLHKWSIPILVDSNWLCVLIFRTFDINLNVISGGLLFSLLQAAMLRYSILPSWLLHAPAHIMTLITYVNSLNNDLLVTRKLCEILEFRRDVFDILDRLGWFLPILRDRASVPSSRSRRQVRPDICTDIYFHLICDKRWWSATFIVK